MTTYFSERSRRNKDTTHLMMKELPERKAPSVWNSGWCACYSHRCCNN